MQFGSPWTTNEASVVFGVEIDGTLECNQEPKQHLDEDEVIEVEVIKGVTLKNLYEKVIELGEKKGYGISSEVA